MGLLMTFEEHFKLQTTYENVFEKERFSPIQ